MDHEVNIIQPERPLVGDDRSQATYVLPVQATRQAPGALSLQGLPAAQIAVLLKCGGRQGSGVELSISWLVVRLSA